MIQGALRGTAADTRSVRRDLFSEFRGSCDFRSCIIDVKRPPPNRQQAPRQWLVGGQDSRTIALRVRNRRWYRLWLMGET